MKIYALLPSLEDQIGHIFEYHIAASKAAKANRWKYFALVPKNCRIKKLPKNWIRCLYMDSWKNPGKFQRLKALFLNLFPIYNLIKKRKAGSVIFFEHRIYYLFPALLLFLFRKPCCQFWIFHRYHFAGQPLKTFLVRVIHRLLFWKVGRKNVRFFTDSELLKKAQEKKFHIKVNVLPVPHAEISSDLNSLVSDQCFLWWPGGSTRKEKGLDNILRLASQMQKTENHFTLIVADSAERKFSNKEKIRFVSSNLSRKEYCNWMDLSALVLLPYLPSEYTCRTSGIFIEAIMCGKMVATTPDTWMAYELEKYHLKELAFHWDCTYLPKKLQNLIENPDLRKKLKKMQKSYRDYHNHENFARLLKQGIKESL